MLHVFEEVQKGNYETAGAIESAREKKKATKPRLLAITQSSDGASPSEGDPSEGSASLDERKVEEEEDQEVGVADGRSFMEKTGIVVESEDTIILEDVPIITPINDVVAKPITMQV